MSTGAILHFAKCGKPGRTLASVRIAHLLSKRYGFPVWDRYDIIRKSYQSLDYAIVVSSASGFAAPAWREQVGELCARARCYIFVQNDYMSAAGQIGTWFERLQVARNRVVWSTVEEMCRPAYGTWKNVRGTGYINWNMLTYDPQPEYANAHTIPGVLYYGAHRGGRQIYFERYFGAGAKGVYPATVSTSVKVKRKWAYINDDVRLIGPFPSVEGIGAWQMGLYLEDQRSHRQYHSPANRFYEMLGAGLPMAFDISTGNTLHKAGYAIEPFTVNSPSSLCALLERSEAVRIAQQAWRRDYRTELLERLAVLEARVGLEAV